MRIPKRFIPWSLITLLAVVCKTNGSDVVTLPTPRTQMSGNYAEQPLSFELNRGQCDQKVKFLCRGSGYRLFLTPTEAVLLNSTNCPRPTVLRMKLVGANPTPRVAGLEELPGKVDYFMGNDSRKWRTNVSTYRKAAEKTL